MKKVILYIAVLAAVASCNAVDVDGDLSSEGKEQASGMITEIISGHVPFTKATIHDETAAFAWTAGDDIAVHVSKGTSHKYVTTVGGAAVDATNTARATFTVDYDAGYSRDYFAIFPSTLVSDADVAANYGQADATLDVKLPSSYTLDQISGTNSPCPMIATNSSGSTGWDFYQLCSLLRLKVNNIPPSTRRLEINFNGKQVCGVFSVTSPESGKYVISTKEDASQSTITITKHGIDVTDPATDIRFNGDFWLDDQVLNIPLPIGKYTRIKITAFNALTGGDTVLTMTRRFSYDATNVKGVKKTTSFSVFSINKEIINYHYVSTKRLMFAPGNLQATYNAAEEKWTWSFADQQYDYIGNASGNTTITTLLKEDNPPYAKLSADGTVDLFGRSTVDNYYGICTSTDNSKYGGEFKDWGAISTFSYRGTATTYVDGYWFTFAGGTMDTEDNPWSWIMNKRTTKVTLNGTGDARYTKATITISDTKKVKGVILFPDRYDGGTPDGVVWGTINGQYSDWSTTCTKSGWEALEDAGCVFVPAAGYRSGTTVYEENVNGYYWVSTLRYTNPICCNLFKTTNDNVYWNHQENCDRQFAVRLAHIVN